MTGPEFAAAHGDSAKWTTVDFEVEINLAEIDAYRTVLTPPPTTPIQPAA